MLSDEPIVHWSTCTESVLCTAVRCTDSRKVGGPGAGGLRHLAARAPDSCGGGAQRSIAIYIVKRLFLFANIRSHEGRRNVSRCARGAPAAPSPLMPG